MKILNRIFLAVVISGLVLACQVCMAGDISKTCSDDPWEATGSWKDFPGSFWGVEIQQKEESLYKWKLVKREGEIIVPYKCEKRSYIPTVGQVNNLWGEDCGVNFRLWKEFPGGDNGDYDTVRIFVEARAPTAAINLLLLQDDNDNFPKPSIEDEAHGCWNVSGFWEEFSDGYWGVEEVQKKGTDDYKWKIVKRSGGKMCSYDSVKRSSPATGAKLDQRWGNNSGNFVSWDDEPETKAGETYTTEVFIFK
ncbi:MAG: hypothetical protein ACOCUF_02930 [Patescibacteria group bacterium]